MEVMVTYLVLVFQPRRHTVVISVKIASNDKYKRLDPFYSNIY